MLPRLSSLPCSNKSAPASLDRAFKVEPGPKRDIAGGRRERGIERDREGERGREREREGERESRGSSDPPAYLRPAAGPRRGGPATLAPHILFKERRGVGLCWAHSQPKGPKGLVVKVPSPRRRAHAFEVKVPGAPSPANLLRPTS